MKISIRKPIGYSRVGRKDRQEDAVWPPFSDVSTANPCIVLCDGVGGSEHGDIASRTSSKVIGEYLTRLLVERHHVDDADVQAAVNRAYDELEKVDTTPSETGKVTMATTLTCVCFHNNGILAAHMGDSRIYHVRPGQGLLYQSDDHSLVNALLKAGELTLEEAKTFPRKNVITKAIQPHSERRFKAEVQHLTDVRSGDYIFLCCDGVLEQVTNERLIEVLSMDCSDQEKCDLLEADSMDRTRDNFTAYLIPIDNVEGVSSIEQDDEIATIVVKAQKPKQGKKTAEPEKTPEPERMPSYKAPGRYETSPEKKNWMIYAIPVLLLALGAALYFGYNHFFPSPKPPTPDTIPQITQTPQPSLQIKYDSSSHTIIYMGGSYKMVPVEGGTFKMGCRDSIGIEREKPAHKVKVDGFVIGETEVTQGLWQFIMDSNPSRWKDDNLPVESVSWNDCMLFIDKLNKATGQKFRLPTEAEWEYAARGGKMSKNYMFSGSDNIDDVAWHAGNSERMTHRVAMKQANELGIFDMSGNVEEWCSDWYSDYTPAEQKSSKDSKHSGFKVLRGGSCDNEKLYNRVSYRGNFGVDDSSISWGLRLVTEP